MLLYGINSIVFCMIRGHLEIVCRTKFHMSVGKTKFYAMKLACACIVIIILLMLVSMWLHRLVSLLILMLYEVCYPAGDGILHMDCVHWGCPVFRYWYDLITAALFCLSFFQSLFLSIPSNSVKWSKILVTSFWVCSSKRNISIRLQFRKNIVRKQGLVPFAPSTVSISTT